MIPMKIDFAKRRRVMELSQRLGHCICDPRRPCPCDVFRDQGICPCAGERPEQVELSQVKLTQLVHNAGCASKIAPADLEAALARLPAVNDPAVISGLAAADDAAIYRISDTLCLVQTVDVFTPCVDDPHLFGRICAANCLSDIYAMGGEPRTALNILAFPSETLPGEVMYQMLAGAMEVLGQAGVALIGGHSLKDPEIKLGFAITGTIDPAVARALETPKVGDLLVLTKPLGTGVLIFARQIGREFPAGLAAAEKSMATLNRAAAEAMRQSGASACTDITGFGLFGHLFRMLRQGKLTARIAANALPSFDGVLDAFQQGIIPGAVERNREFVGEALQIAADVVEARVHLGFDAQTSGGLLIAIPPDRLAALQRSLAERGCDGCVIGQITGPSDGRIEVTADLPPDLSALPVNSQTTLDTMNTPSPAPDAHPPGCCADVFNAPHAPSSVGESQKAFAALIRSVQGPGVLDEKTKELILFSLVIYSRCHPCFDAHYEKALKLGLTQAQLDEAAWCAIALGGAPVRMFYQESLAKTKA
ncbi:MAG: selenide, water dikinase SelD [Verrucomicrobiota bacterium]